MSRTNIDLDDEACRTVMDLYQLRPPAPRLGVGRRPRGAAHGARRLILVDYIDPRSEAVPVLCHNLNKALPGKLPT